MKSPTIEFVNHASVIISYEDVSILSDPWFSGTAFHDGWRLMYELQDNEITDILKKITHVYISHEHPDHFRPTFLANDNIKKILVDRKIEFLFQNTKDKRIVDFLKKQGFKVKELNSNKKNALKLLETTINRFLLRADLSKIKELERKSAKENSNLIKKIKDKSINVFFYEIYEGKVKIKKFL